MKLMLNMLLLVLLFGCNQSEHSKVIESYPDGSPKVIHIYSSPKDSTSYIFKEFYNNGVLSFESIVAEGKFVQYKKAYLENGNPIEFVELFGEAEFDFCCPDGFYSTYYENGNLEQTHYKRGGNFNGLVTSYDTAGNKTIEYEVINGLRNGEVKDFYENGIVYSVRTYAMDTLIGKVYYFNEKGDSLKWYSTFNGSEDFPTKKWLTNGQIFYGRYTDSTYGKVEYLWTDSLGNTMRKLYIESGDESEYVSEGGWITPN